MSNERDVVIIGAGAAGIGAARRLAGTGLSVLLLDAMARLGGRAWTQHVAGMPLDLGCEWLHSADRNPWVGIAEQSGIDIIRHSPPWDTQYRDLGFPPADQDSAGQAFAAWTRRLHTNPPADDRAAAALEPGGRWNAYLQAMSGYLNGADLEHLSVADYLAYDDASTEENWQLPGGYGALITQSLPPETEIALSTPVHAIALDARRVTLTTPSGTLHARTVIVTIPTDILASPSIRWPTALDPWRDAASHLPLGHDEKLFLEVIDPESSPFAPDSHVIGDPHDATTGSYHISPFGRPVIECFLGGPGARAVTTQGTPAAFARATDQLAHLFGTTARRHLRPLLASNWATTPSIGGAYSHAHPGHAGARAILARPFDNRLFFAGEATHASDFSTAHGAYLSGQRAGAEAIAALAA